MLVFIGGLAAALFVNGAWAFSVYQLVYFMNPENRWWAISLPSISYSYISVVVLGFVLIMRYKDESKKAILTEQPLTKWLAGILLMYIFLFLFALDFPPHKQSTIELAKLFIVMAFAYKLINDEKKLRLALWSYILGATYVGYVAFGTGRNQGLRVEGIGTVDSPDSNGIAAAIAPALVLLVYYAWMGNKYIKAATVVCAALIVNAIVLINSRGAFLAAAVGGAVFILYMLFSRVQHANQRFMAILIICGGLGGAYSLTDNYFWERMETIQEYEDSEKSGSHRTEFWLATFDMLEDHPMGLGVRGYNKISKFYLDPEKYGDLNKSVHSSWFQVLAEIGWIGLALFIGMLRCCYKLSVTTKRYLVENQKIDQYFLMFAIETSLLSYLVAATFINRCRAEILYWLVLFVACAVNILYFQKQKDINGPNNSKGR